MDRPSSTVEASAASKNISPNFESDKDPRSPAQPTSLSGSGSRTGFSDKQTSYEKGLTAERRVQDYFTRQGFALRGRRVRTPFAEVDLCLQCSRRHKVLLIEVKLSDADAFHPHLLSKRQRQRLQRAAQWYAEKLSDEGLEVQLLLAIVSRWGQIKLFFDAFV